MKVNLTSKAGTPMAIAFSGWLLYLGVSHAITEIRKICEVRSKERAWKAYYNCDDKENIISPMFEPYLFKKSKTDDNKTKEQTDIPEEAEETKEEVKTDELHND